MPQGDPGGNFAGSGGYGGNFGGAGGASMGSSPGGPAHGSLGFGGMSPGGYNSTTYARNMAGLPGTPGFGARVEANRANYNRRQQLAQARAQLEKFPNNVSLQRRVTKLQSPGVVQPAVTTPPTETESPPELMEEPPYPGMQGAPYPAGIYGNNWLDNTTTGYGTGDFPTQGPYGSGARAAPVNNFAGSGATGVGTNPSYGFSGFAGDVARGVSGLGGLIGDSVRGWGGILGGNRQFGGPVEPGQQYTVGENGPETLQMGPGGGGQVIPHNPMDRLGSMNPQMMQQLFQMQRQFGGGNQGPGGQPPAGPQPAPRPQGGGGFQPGMAQPPAQPPAPQPPQAGGWQNRMGIEGLSRPMRPQGGGFGLSGLGQSGVMNQLRRQGGFTG